MGGVRRAAVAGLEALFSKSPSRGSLQVALKCGGLLLIRKRHIGLQAPWRVFRGVLDIPSIVSCKSGPQIGGLADIKVRSLKALEDVNVFHTDK